MKTSQVTGILLSGGDATRMNGANKAFLRVGGERLIDRTVSIFRNIFDDVILVTNTPRDYLDLDLTIVTDIVKGKGPLGGIYTGLFFCETTHAFIAACDMPYLNESFIRSMIEAIGDYDIVIPEMHDGLQPLHAVYSRRCLPAMRKFIDDDKLKIIGFFRPFRVLRILEETVRRYDPEGRMFLNVNFPSDLADLQ